MVIDSWWCQHHNWVDVENFPGEKTKIRENFPAKKVQPSNSFANQMCMWEKITAFSALFIHFPVYKSEETDNYWKVHSTRSEINQPKALQRTRTAVQVAADTAKWTISFDKTFVWNSYQTCLTKELIFCVFSSWG